MRNHRPFLPCITENCWSLEMNCSAIVILDDAVHQGHFIKQLRAKAAARIASGESHAFGSCFALSHMAGVTQKKNKQKDVVSGSQ